MIRRLKEWFRRRQRESKNDEPRFLLADDQENLEPVHEITVNNFSFNTDGSGMAEFSNTHQNSTATGIPNQGPILGYTIPLEMPSKKIKLLPSGVRVCDKFQAAILEFRSGDSVIRLLGVANDTGGYHRNANPNDRRFGELGLHTWFRAKEHFDEIHIEPGILNTPPDMTLHYIFLNVLVKNEDQYKRLLTRLQNKDLI